MGLLNERKITGHASSTAPNHHTYNLPTSKNNNYRDHKFVIQTPRLPGLARHD